MTVNERGDQWTRVPLWRKSGPWENWISLRLSPQICLKHRTPESVATLPPFSPIEGQKWFDQISSQWESQKNRLAFIYFGKIQFLPLCIWNLPFMSTTSGCRDRVILRMRTWKCVRQNNALIGSSMVRALGPYWLPNSYNSKNISKLSHSTYSATSKSSATSQSATKFFGSERHV